MQIRLVLEWDSNHLNTLNPDLIISRLAFRGCLDHEEEEDDVMTGELKLANLLGVRNRG